MERNSHNSSLQNPSFPRSPPSPDTGTQAPEDDVLQVKRVLDDAGGGHTDPQHVLLGGQVARGGNAVHIGQVAATEQEQGCSGQTARGGDIPSNQEGPAGVSPETARNTREKMEQGLPPPPWTGRSRSFSVSWDTKMLIRGRLGRDSPALEGEKGPAPGFPREAAGLDG